MKNIEGNKEKDKNSSICIVFNICLLLIYLLIL
jgi:hypothetical protein